MSSSSSPPPQEKSTTEQTPTQQESTGNAFTPVAKRTVPGFIIGGCVGLTYAKIVGETNVAQAAMAGSAQGLVFTGVYFGCNTFLCWKDGVDPYKSNLGNHAISGALTGAVYRTLKRGFAGSLFGSILGAGMGSAFYLTHREFDHWRDRERRRMLWQLEGGDDAEFMKREGTSNRIWNALTNLPSWFPIQFHDEENAADDDRRADLRVKERLERTYEGFDGPKLASSEEEKDDTPIAKSRKMRMHRPNTFIVAKFKQDNSDS